MGRIPVSPDSKSFRTLICAAEMAKQQLVDQKPAGLKIPDWLRLSSDCLYCRLTFH